MMYLLVPTRSSDCEHMGMYCWRVCFIYVRVSKTLRTLHLKMLYMTLGVKLYKIGVQIKHFLIIHRFILKLFFGLCVILPLISDEGRFACWQNECAYLFAQRTNSWPGIQCCRMQSIFRFFGVERYFDFVTISATTEASHKHTQHRTAGVGLAPKLL